MRRSCLFPLLLITLAAVRAQEAKRPLAIEDYYRIQAVAGPAISPDGRALLFTTSTRLEVDNSTATGTWWIPAEGSLEPTRVQHYGKDVTAARWTDGRLEYTAESERWSIDPWKAAPRRRRRRGHGQAPRCAWPRGRRQTRHQRLQSRAPTASGSPGRAIEPSRRRRRRSRRISSAATRTLQGRDIRLERLPARWTAVPRANMRARPAAQIVIAPASGGELKAITDLDLRPSGITWHPDGSKLLYIADPDWRDELKYESPDLWTVTTAGAVTRLTDDGYVYSDAAFLKRYPIDAKRVGHINELQWWNRYLKSGPSKTSS